MMMKKSMRRFEACLVGFACLAAPVVRASDLPECPKELTVRQSVDGEPAGWQALSTHDKHPYVGVSFTEGPPDRKVILAPSRSKRVHGASVSTWSLAKSNDGYWVSCLYGETSATVATKLPSDVAHCEVEYDKRFSRPVAKRWRCVSGTAQK